MPVAFGQFHAAEPITLCDGLNVFVGENEAGKSTLQAFIYGMLYGFKREGRLRVSRLPEFEKYRPWVGDQYRGIIVYDHNGREYRVERSFDPDNIRIFDEATGEDLTEGFTQDVRKEYDFCQKHLGLSAKEFKNTVWIEQLGSAQEPGLGTEIQGKLESILQGGAEDVSLSKALTVLADERSKIKTPRSTKALLDQLSRKIELLDEEMSSANLRETEIRGLLLRLTKLNRQKDEAEQEIREDEAYLEQLRLSSLQETLSTAADLEGREKDLLDEIQARDWAKDFTVEAENAYKQLSGEKEVLFARLDDAKKRVEALTLKKAGIEEKLLKMQAVKNTGLDEPKVATLYSGYSSSRARVIKGERSANEARRELRTVEQEVSSRDLLSRNLSDEIVQKADEHRETLVLAEKQKSILDVEAEKARAQAASYNPGGASSWLYVLALAVLGIASLFTLMGMPFGIPTFAAAVLVFCIGLFRQSKISKIKKQWLESLAEKEELVAQQLMRVQEAEETVSSYIASFGVSTLEQLRALVRDAQSQRSRLKAAKEKYDLTHHFWFEASQELSEAEKELLGAMREAQVLKGNEPITDAAVESLKRLLKDLASLTAESDNVSQRLSETGELADGLENQWLSLEQREEAIFQGSNVNDSQGFLQKQQARLEYLDLTRTYKETAQRRSDVLAGRDISDLEKEVGNLRNLGVEIQSDTPGPGEYEQRQRDLEAKKQGLSQLKLEIASISEGVRVRQTQGRPPFVISEDLSRAKETEEELTFQRDALDMAYSTLDQLSKNLRRDIVPTLNKRVSEILDQITQGKYNQARVSADLEMSVVNPSTGSLTGIHQLSGGTLDQCYFALRVALAEIVTGNETFPMFLDDSFVQYDDRRLEEAIKTISALSQRNQIVLFTCHGREAETIQRLGLKAGIQRLG